MLRRLFLGLGLAYSARAVALPRELAPDFKGRTLAGESFSRDSLKGKPVLIQFWATWCGFCRRDQPAVEQIVAFYKDKLVVLAVSVRESEAAVKRYLAESPRRSRIVLHDQTNLVAQFRPEAFPCYVMIDAQGGIVGDQQGAGGIEALRALVARAGL